MCTKPGMVQGTNGRGLENSHLKCPIGHALAMPLEKWTANLRTLYGGEFVKWVGESRPDDSRRGGFRLAARLAVLAVVAHDDGVRLKYAGWSPQDDVSDVNVTAVYKRASLSTSVESRCGSEVLRRLVHSPRQHPYQPASQVFMAVGLHGDQRPAPARQLT